LEKVAKSIPNIHIEAEIESPKHKSQNTFETLKYLPKTKR